MKKFSSAAMEREFFRIASPEAVLTYLDEFATAVLNEISGPWGPNSQLSEVSAQILIKKMDRTIDSGLIRALSSGYTDYLLERNGVKKEEPNVADFDLLTIALSGLGMYQFYDPPFWLDERLEKILTSASDEQLRLLFQNPFFQASAIEKILHRQQWAKNLSDDRFIEVVFHLLGNKLITNQPRDDYDYDSSQHGIIQSCWNLLLILEPTIRNASFLAARLENFQEIELPYQWRESINLNYDNSSNESGNTRLDEIKHFLQFIFNKWDHKSSEGSESDSRYFEFIKEYTVRKIPSHYWNDLREFLLSYDSPSIVKGYFASLVPYNYNLENFNSDLTKYKKNFLEGLSENPASFHIHNKKLGILIRKAVNLYEEEEGVEWFDTIKRKYYGMHEHFKDKYPSIIINDVDNFEAEG
jgi:hypothetical protein